MKVIRDNLWLCVDCMTLACTGDASSIESERRIARINEGLDALGPFLVPDFDSESFESSDDDDDNDNGIKEFASCGCDCCGSGLAGTMHRFAILGEGTDDHGQ